MNLKTKKLLALTNIAFIALVCITAQGCAKVFQTDVSANASSETAATFSEYWIASKQGDTKKIKSMMTDGPYSHLLCGAKPIDECREIKMKAPKPRSDDGNSPSFVTEHAGPEVVFLPNLIRKGIWKDYKIVREHRDKRDAKLVVELSVGDVGKKEVWDVLLHKPEEKWKIFGIEKHGVFEAFAESPIQE